MRDIRYEKVPFPVNCWPFDEDVLISSREASPPFTFIMAAYIVWHPKKNLGSDDWRRCIEVHDVLENHPHRCIDCHFSTSNRCARPVRLYGFRTSSEILRRPRYPGKTLPGVHGARSISCGSTPETTHDIHNQILTKASCHPAPSHITSNAQRLSQSAPEILNRPW